MKLEHELCYLALKSRDARFDGHFFTGVRTTGIYCRPVCPAKTPHSKNVRFYACAAAAEAAGFRPCLRCRPEASPGTPAWLGTSSTVSRALQLISDGALDDEEVTVDDLAQQLGIGSRHLRRLFEEHLGASPLKVAQTRRVHFAKKLVEETALSMSQIVFASGFSSIRRFNTAFRNVYQQPPSSFRRDKENGPAQKNPSLELKLSYRPPLDQKSLLNFLSARAIPGVESVDDSGYRRTVRIGKTSGVIQVRFTPDEHLVLNVPSQLSKGLNNMIRTLTALPGIGPWTAHYVAMRAFAEPDAFPAEDLALRRAAAQPAREILSKSELLQRAEAWRPWRAYAAMYLWTTQTTAKRKVIR